MDRMKEHEMDILKVEETDYPHNKISSQSNSTGQSHVMDNSEHLLGEPPTTLQGDSKNSVTAKDEFFRYKLAKQTLLFFLWIAMGIGRGIVGPSIPDLKDHFDSDYEEIGRVMAMSSIGFIAGALFGGVIIERLHRYMDLILSVAVLIGGTTGAVLPWLPSISFVTPFFLVCGFAMSIQNAAGNVMVLELWAEKAASAMFTLHFGYGIGAFVAPLIAKPFLSAKIGEIIIANVSDMNVTGNWTNVTEIEEIRSPARLKYPFAIEGICNVVFALAFLAYYIKGPPKGMPVKKGTSKMKDLFHPGKCAGGNSLYGTLLLILLFLFYIQALGGEAVFGQFLFTFAIESDVQFTTSQAADLTSVFYLCHLSGRATGAVLSKFISITVLIIVDLIGLIASSIFLALFGHYVPIALWIGTGFVGLLCSFIYPAGLIWPNLYMDVNSMVIMVTMIGGSVGFFAYTYLGGYLIQNVSMRSFLYLEVVCCIILGVIFLLMCILAKTCGTQKRKQTDVAEDVDVKHVDS